MPHKKGTDKVSDLHEFSLDYCFPGDTGGVSPLKVLVARERLTNMVLAAVVPRNGPNRGVALRVATFIEELGCAYLDVITKSDREPAIRALLR